MQKTKTTSTRFSLVDAISVVGLSDIDLNKYDAILRFKSSIPVNPLQATVPIKNISVSNRKVNEYGEAMVGTLGQSQKRFDETEVLMLAAAYSDGKTTYELAEQYGCDRLTVTRALKKHGVNVTKSKAQAKLDTEKVIALYESMHTTDEIAKMHGVNPQTILRCLRAHGVKIRGRWDYR